MASNWQCLNLLCQEEEIPYVVNPDDGVGGHLIPDEAWREVKRWAPTLEVQFVFSSVFFQKFFSHKQPIHRQFLNTIYNLFNNSTSPHTVPCYHHNNHFQPNNQINKHYCYQCSQNTRIRQTQEVPDKKHSSLQLFLNNRN